MADPDLSDLDFSGLGPADFAKLVAGASRSELTEATSGELRGPILDEVFGRMASQFKPSKAGHLKALIRFRITGRPDGGADEYEMTIADGTCSVGPVTGADPRLVVTADPVNFLKLVSGNASGPGLFMTRKLKLSGDLGLGAGLMNLFDVPKP